MNPRTSALALALLVVVATFLVASAASVLAQDSKQTKGTFELKNPGNPGYVMWIHIPDELENVEDAPVIFLLHGTGDSARNFIYRFVPHLNANGFIAVAIQSPTPSGQYPWEMSEKSAVLDAIAEFRKHYDVDENAMYLAGFSAGGWGTCRYFLTEPGTFAAVAVCGGATYARRMHQSGAEKTPIYLQVGEDDRFFSTVQRAAEDFRNAGFEVKYESFPGVGHTYPTDPNGQQLVVEFFRMTGGATRANQAMEEAAKAMRARRYEEAEALVHKAKDALDFEIPDGDEYADTRREVEALRDAVEKLDGDRQAAWERHLSRNRDEQAGMEVLAQADRQIEAGELGAAVTTLGEFVEEHGDDLVTSRLARVKLIEVLGEMDADARTAAANGLWETEAERIFRRAERYHQRRRHAQARPILEEIVKRFPYTTQAEKAQQYLDASD